MRPQHPYARIAVAGAGLIGKRHIEIIQHLEHATMVGVADPDPAAKAYCQQLGVGHYASLEDLLDTAKPDGVIIATPNNPNALSFDPSYVYAANQGIRGFLGFRYVLW